MPRLIAAGVALLMVPVVLVMALVIGLSGDSSQQGIAGLACASGESLKTGAVGPYRGQQLANAAAIVQAGQEMRLPERAWVIAVAVAIQESTLINLDHGDTAGPDSRGLFQQRDSWGTLRERTTPKVAATLFYERLVQVEGWESIPLTAGERSPAQQVQRSALPNAYAAREQDAQRIVGYVLNRSCPAPAPDGGGVAPNPRAQVVIDRALSQRGQPYVWGGGDAHGPTTGLDGTTAGFDCSGLAVYAYAGIGVTVPHHTGSIYQRFQPAITDPQQVQPGDLILLSGDGTPSGIHHLGIYLGDGRVVHAPQQGEPVQVDDGIWQSSFWSGEFIGAVRPGVAPGRG